MHRQHLVIMKAHVIKDGKVVNTIIVDAIDGTPNLIPGDFGGIGWDYIDGKLVDNRPEDPPVV